MRDRADGFCPVLQLGQRSNLIVNLAAIVTLIRAIANRTQRMSVINTHLLSAST